MVTAFAVFLLSFFAEIRRKAVSKLPEVQRRRLNLYFFGELTYEQIAKMEGCKYQAVQCSIKAAIKAIKKFMK